MFYKFIVQQVKAHVKSTQISQTNWNFHTQQKQTITTRCTLAERQAEKIVQLRFVHEDNNQTAHKKAICSSRKTRVDTGIVEAGDGKQSPKILAYQKYFFSYEKLSSNQGRRFVLNIGGDEHEG